MRVGVYDRYWQTLGGGEQFAGGIAEVLRRGNEVELLGLEPIDPSLLQERLGVDISGTTFRRITDEASVTDASSRYDLFVNCTYLSFAPSAAPSSMYVVHFPNPPKAGSERLVENVAKLGGRTMLVAPGMSSRVRRIGQRLAEPARPQDALQTYSVVAANSDYTRGWVEKLWGVGCQLLYPPVRTMADPPDAAEKRPAILSLGRFMLSKNGHSKKQLEMIAAFRRLQERPDTSGWEFLLIGGAASQDRDYAMAVRRAALDARVRVEFNATGATVRRALRDASIYWHLAGLGEDPWRHPDRFEHFGISVVEAMAGGAVPIVFDAAGPAEIVGDAGVRVRTLDELVTATYDLIGDPARMSDLRGMAIERAKEFAMPAFERRLRALVDKAKS